MYIILGGTGHVGSAVARSLLDRGESITVVGRDPDKAKDWVAQGARYASVDVHDAEALHRVLRTGRRAFVLNPPADTSTDTDVEERRTICAIVHGLEGSGLQMIVAESTYGAHAGERVGDLSTLYELEQGLASCAIPVIVQRAAYYYSNWDAALKSATERGILESFYPEDFVLPMVAPADLGRSAASFLCEPAIHAGLHYVEGPQRCTARDVAAAFSKALAKPVRVVVIPKAQWFDHYRSLGFSAAAADSYARMTERTLDDPCLPTDPIRGQVTLDDYVSRLVRMEQCGTTR